MITTISVEERSKWDRIVRSFRNPDVNYFNAYAEAFHQCGEGEPKLIYFEKGQTRAINVIMERDIALAEPFQGKVEPNRWFDIATPYGYGGFWIEGDDP